MKNIDLKYHRLRLSVIRNRYVIGACMLLFLWAFSFVMGFLVLAKIQSLVEELQEGQKGNTCILLIQPKDRTKQNVTSCIQNNKKKPDNNFQFKTSESSSQPYSKKPTNITTSSVYTFYKPSQSVQPLASSSSTRTPANIFQPYISPIETRINSLGKLECKHLDDTIWVLGDCR